MKNITMETEKRINEMIKNDNKYGAIMEDILNTLKSNNGLYGATIKEMKSWNETLSNEFQINYTENYVLNGLSVMYNELINTVHCLDLSYITVRDFNELVKTCYSL